MHTIPAALVLAALLAGLTVTRSDTHNLTSVAGPAGRPASLAFGDFDRDGLADAASISASGVLRLRRNLGDGRFEDVTELAGLAGVENASLSLWQDFDGDGLLDLLVGTHTGPRKLFLNLGDGRFDDVADELGLEGAGGDQSAHWIDTDNDGRLDLHLEGTTGVRLYHARSDGTFEEHVLEAGVAGPVSTPIDGAFVIPGAGASTVDGASVPAAGHGSAALDGLGTRAGTGTTTAFVTGPPGGAAPMMPALGCIDSINDQAGGACLKASSVPTPGKLFPGPHLGGVNNVQSGTNSFVGGGKNNGASASYATVGGGLSNHATASRATVGGGGGNDASGQYAMVAGGAGNVASGFYATVGGGHSSTAGPGNYATVGGGEDNEASGASGTVAGGITNTAGGNYSVVGGGKTNVASAHGTTIAGGRNNLASGGFATIGGGNGHLASGGYSTVAGGLDCEALGTYSFAAGRRASASHAGSFVWGDSQDLSKPSSASDQFNVYADGGARIFAVGTLTPSLLVDSAGKVGIGTATPATTLDVNGAITIRGGADIVEGFETNEPLEPGTVVVIDPENAGALKASSTSYDRKVAGIVSGAGGVAPGIHLGQDGVMDGSTKVAMSGRVYVKASAENGPIHPGDLLTTATLAGHAMRVTEAERSFGAVIGKAMSALDEGTGLVLVLVNLQ